MISSNVFTETQNTKAVQSYLCLVKHLSSQGSSMCILMTCFITTIGMHFVWDNCIHMPSGNISRMAGFLVHFPLCILFSISVLGLSQLFFADLPICFGHWDILVVAETDDDSHQLAPVYSLYQIHDSVQSDCDHVESCSTPHVHNWLVKGWFKFLWVLLDRTVDQLVHCAIYSFPIYNLVYLSAQGDKCYVIPKNRYSKISIIYFALTKFSVTLNKQWIQTEPFWCCPGWKLD